MLCYRASEVRPPYHLHLDVIGERAKQARHSQVYSIEIRDIYDLLHGSA